MLGTTPRAAAAQADSATGIPGSIILTQLPLAPTDAYAKVEPCDNRTTPPAGSRIVVIDPTAPSVEPEILTSGFAAAHRPNLAFDAKRFLFVGRRKPSDRNGVWEMNLDGTGLREIPTAPLIVHQALYLSTIYSMNADAPVHQIAFLAEPSAGEPPAMFTCRLDGSHRRRITFAPGCVSDPLLLSDGRLLLSTPAVRNAPDSRGRQQLITTWMTIHVDGTGLFPFASKTPMPARRSMPCETPGGTVVHVASFLSSHSSGHALVAFSRTGRLHTRQEIAVNPSGRFHSPSALRDGRLLVSHRTTEQSSQLSTYGLYSLDTKPKTGVSRIFDDPKWHEIDAVVVHPRPAPDGRSSVVQWDADSTEPPPPGHLYGLDLYLSDTAEGKSIPRGAIRQLRVIQSQPESTHPEPKTEIVLGELPVEPDGSFYVEVPSQKPLRLETLDETGSVLQSMKSWIWVMPNERRGCVGCHEDRELTPPNRHVLALRKAPVKLDDKKPPAKATPK